jgi:hypothetical protein
MRCHSCGSDAAKCAGNEECEGRSCVIRQHMQGPSRKDASSMHLCKPSLPLSGPVRFYGEDVLINA